MNAGRSAPGWRATALARAGGAPGAVRGWCGALRWRARDMARSAGFWSRRAAWYEHAGVVCLCIFFPLLLVTSVPAARAPWFMGAEAVAGCASGALLIAVARLWGWRR